MGDDNDRDKRVKKYIDNAELILIFIIGFAISIAVTLLGIKFFA